MRSIYFNFITTKIDESFSLELKGLPIPRKNEKVFLKNKLFIIKEVIHYPEYKEVVVFLKKPSWFHKIFNR